MKYTDTQVTFQEFPDEVSLCINISNCPFHCKGCHSPELWEDIGTKLTFEELDSLIKNNEGITCVGFMGGVPKNVNSLAFHIHMNYPSLKVGWYWGGDKVPSDIELEWFDYIKLGSYIEELGGLDNPNTNQKMYSVKDWKDITSNFWKDGRQ